MQSLCYGVTLPLLFSHPSWILLSFAIWSGFWAGSSHASEEQSSNIETLSYEKAVELALRQALDVQRADIGLALAEANQEILSHELDPRWLISSSMSELRPRNTNLLMNNVGNAARTGTALALQLTGVIYDFGRHAARMSQSQAQKEMQAFSRQDATLSLRFRVARAYAAWIEADRLLSISEDRIQISKLRVRQQESNYRRGLRPENEVISARLDLGRAELATERSRMDLQMARQRLAQVMNIPVAALAKMQLPKDLLPLRDPVHWDTLVKSSVGDLAISPRDMRLAKEVESLSHEEDLIRRNLRPTLSGSIQAQHIIPWEGKGRDLISAQIQLSWDIPWNGMYRDEMQRVSLRRRDLGLVTEQEAQSRRDRETQARLTWEMARSQWQGVQRQVELTKRQHELMQRLYDSGRASALELSSAEADDVAQRLELIRLQSTMMMAVIDLAEARGIWNLEGVFR